MSKLAELTAEANALLALVAKLIKVVKGVREEFGGDDLPPLAESLDEAERIEGRIQDRKQQWFADRGITPP